MMLYSRSLLLATLIGTTLLVSTDGGSNWLPELARIKLPSASLRNNVPEPARALQQPAPPANEQAARPAQTPVPAKTAPSLSDEVKRVQRNRLACVAEPGQLTDIFASKSWYVPPPPPKPLPPPPPPPPTAPPLPFTFMGSYHEPDGKLILFLTVGERLYTVSSGDVIDGIYRVEEIVNGQLGLTYLPLNIRQSMSIGESS